MIISTRADQAARAEPRRREFRGTPQQRPARLPIVHSCLELSAGSRARRPVAEMSRSRRAQRTRSADRWHRAEGGRRARRRGHALHRPAVFTGRSAPVPRELQDRPRPYREARRLQDQGDAGVDLQTGASSSPRRRWCLGVDDASGHVDDDRCLSHGIRGRAGLD